MEHKKEFLQAYCEDNETPLLVVGHSIGGYMAIEAVKRWAASKRGSGKRVTRSQSSLQRAPSPSQNCKIMALMPYMQFDEDSSKQRTLRRIAKRPYIPAAIASAVGFVVPKFLLLRLLTAFDKNLEKQSATCIAEHLLSYTVGHNAFSLAQDEFRYERPATCPPFCTTTTIQSSHRAQPFSDKN